MANKISYYNLDAKKSSRKFGRDLRKDMILRRKKEQPLVLLCIGTDRATGDCLGPLVGHYLSRCSLDCFVYGSLGTPVHALNLPDTIDFIYTHHANPFIIAIDACLGCPEHVGYVTMSSLPLFPGKGVSKNLPPIGDISITGIVNVTSKENDWVIQNTKPQLVVELASFIASGLEASMIRPVSYLQLL